MSTICNGYQQTVGSCYVHRATTKVISSRTRLQRLGEFWLSSTAACRRTCRQRCRFLQQGIETCALPLQQTELPCARVTNAWWANCRDVCKNIVGKTRHHEAYLFPVGSLLGLYQEAPWDWYVYFWIALQVQGGVFVIALDDCRRSVDQLTW